MRDDTEPFFVKQESEGNRFEWTEKEANVAGEIVDLTLPPLPDSSNGLVNMDTSPSNSIRKNISTSHEPQTDVQSTLSEQTRSPSRNQEPQEENSNGHHLGTLGFFSGGWGEVPFFTYTSNATEATRSVLRSPEETPLPLPTKIQIESGLTMKTPAIEAFVSAECIKLKLPGIRQGFKIREEIDQILKTVRHLEFYTTRGNLAQYLENREKMPGKKLQALPICDMSNLGGILDALQTVKTNTADNKIHRAYGQKLLYNSVNNNVDKGYKSTVTGRVFTQTAILEELALKKAGPVSKREKHQMISAYLNEYHAGRKWSAVFDSFGGSGMVLVFVIAGK